MNPSVHVETSVISYLSAKPSRDIVIAAHQQVTRQWWRSRSSYRLFVSQIVRDEAAVGDPTARAGRLRALRGVPALAVTDEVTQLAGELVRRGALPKKATVDAFHAADHLHARGAAIREFNMKRRDPVSEELHLVRENIGKAHDFDVHRIAAAIRQHEDENPAGIVRESPKRTMRRKKA